MSETPELKKTETVNLASSEGESECSEVEAKGDKVSTHFSFHFLPPRFCYEMYVVWAYRTCRSWQLLYFSGPSFRSQRRNGSQTEGH